jgi:hypothetical protein
VDVPRIRNVLDVLPAATFEPERPRLDDRLPQCAALDPVEFG